MQADNHNPETPPASEELTGNLKRAVDAVKGQQPPRSALITSLDRARRIDALRKARWQRERSLIAAGAIAASLLLTLLLGIEPARQGQDHDGRADILVGVLATTDARHADKRGQARFDDPDIPHLTNDLPNVAVPGVALPDEPIGIPGAPEGEAMTVPTPPGRGTGADG